VKEQTLNPIRSLWSRVDLSDKLLVVGESVAMDARAELIEGLKVRRLRAPSAWARLHLSVGVRGIPGRDDMAVGCR
jgi:hypothetical protein